MPEGGSGHRVEQAGAGSTRPFRLPGDGERRIGDSEQMTLLPGASKSLYCVRGGVITQLLPQVARSITLGGVPCAAPRPLKMLAFLLLLVLLLASDLETSGAATQINLRSSAHLQSTTLSNKTGASSIGAPPSTPSCPSAGLTPIQRSQPGTGHHKVVLSWNASSPSSDSESIAVGYCLYRSKKQYAAKQNPICSDCEQINRTPVTRTDCVDDLVEDNVKYYYVVTGINARGEISPSSNEVTAPIPPQGQTHLVTKPYHSCRVGNKRTK